MAVLGHHYHQGQRFLVVTAGVVAGLTHPVKVDLVDLVVGAVQS